MTKFADVIYGGGVDFHNEKPLQRELVVGTYGLSHNKKDREEGDTKQQTYVALENTVYIVTNL